MNTIKTKIEKYLSKNCILIFAIVTFLIILNHTPYWDETNAYNISQLKLSEIFYITRIEGHTFLWYLILKIFCPLNFFPFGMFLINWLFCLVALTILWKKAPFTPIQKTLITFSTPFLYFFAPIARCYSIGLMFLFLTCALYRKRFKHPYLFALSISIGANTSIMVAIGSFYIGLLFLHDLFLKFKHNNIPKKHFYNVIIIFGICTLILLLQFIGFRDPDPTEKTLAFGAISRYVLLPKATTLLPFILHLFSSISFYYYAFLLFKKTKRGLFFISSTYITLTILFLYIYQGSHWNHYFYFIYFIVLFWIFGKKILCNKFSKFLFMTILVLFLFPKAVIETGKMDLIYASKSHRIAKKIIETPNIQNGKIYAFEWWGDIAPGALPYLAQHNINIYDWHDRNRRSFESQKNIFKLRNERMDVISLLEKNINKEEIYIATSVPFEQQKYLNMNIIATDEKTFIFQRDDIKFLLTPVNNENTTLFGFFKVIKL